MEAEKVLSLLYFRKPYNIEYFRLRSIFQFELSYSQDSNCEFSEGQGTSREGSQDIFEMK